MFMQYSILDIYSPSSCGLDVCALVVHIRRLGSLDVASLKYNEEFFSSLFISLGVYFGLMLWYVTLGN